ncbi:hypothetical protein HHK36_026947 [Tetracentron sinense]|uniref:Uncharacterized protein n=1 Tax=Tetracentron sinense TaxID=13715 RepID=A0A834YMA6_TETSI|nr:hypothetical protein HHK36_026947 [Tetracentron sinense]
MVTGVSEAHHPLCQRRLASDTLAPLLALQFTVFPNYGFCIGIIIRHVIVDGQSSTMFLKSWASICRSGDSSLSPELLPFYDRTVIKDPEGLEKFFLNKFVKSTESETEFNIVDPRAPSNTVKTTFELSRGDIQRLKK